MNRKRSVASALAAFSIAVLASTATHAACIDCGTVTDVNTVTEKGQSSGGGAVVGGILGGVLGHQVGSGRGNTAATIVGAGAGAYAGNEVEKNKNTVTKYAVHVKMEDGSNRTFTYSNPTSYRTGDKVKIVDHKLVHR
jgi:outer membrane lipoprotein SlyB